jgi:HD-GYP domain-containing protein (c-di-GMP phosphodiesterase class II)
VDEAIREIEHQSGQQFDPQVVAALRQILQEDAADRDDDGPEAPPASTSPLAQSPATRLPTRTETDSPNRGRATRG